MILYPETNFNSWISEDDADSYFETRLHSERWIAEGNKEAALITAFRVLNDLNLTLISQADGTLSNAYTDTETAEILDRLKRAQCEQAIWLLIHDPDETQVEGLNLGGVLSVKLPAGKVEKPPRVSPRAMGIIGQYVNVRTVTRTR